MRDEKNQTTRVRYTAYYNQPIEKNPLPSYFYDPIINLICLTNYLFGSKIMFPAETVIIIYLE